MTCLCDHKVWSELSFSYSSYLLGHNDGPEVASDHIDSMFGHSGRTQLGRACDLRQSYVFQDNE